MEEIVRNLSSLSWWFGVVIVGIVLNIASAYLKSPIDKGISQLSRKWQERSERSLRARQAKIAELRSSQQAQSLLIAEEMRNRLRHLSMVIFSLLFLVLHIYILSSEKSNAADVWPLGSWWIAKQITYVSSLAMMFFAMQCHWTAMTIKSLLEQANKNDSPLAM